jgi:hypothetical protein
MDAETKKLLEELKVTIEDSKRPFINNILQSIIVAIVIYIPSAIIVGNKFENRVINIEIQRNEEVRLLKNRANKIDYNFELIEDKHPELNFIKISETE